MAPVQTENPLAEAMARVGDRWTLLIVEALLRGPRRFNELADDVAGIAPNILSSRLRHLEREAIVVSRPYSRRPLRVAYELTAVGRDLAGALRLLAHWASRTFEDADPPRHPVCGSTLEARWFCPTCARVVSDDEGAELHYV